MPTPYINQQSPLEYYALNGSTAGLSRPALLNKTFLKYQKPFSETNPYGLTQTNAISDTLTPYRGKGTGDKVNITSTDAGYEARYNYKGGDGYDINGSTATNPAGTSIVGNGIGRNAAILYNITTFGYGVNVNTPTDKKNWYTHPDTSKNIGQVII